MADRKAQFIELPLLPAERLPEGPHLAFELTLDGFRAQAIKTGGQVSLRSRNNKDFKGSRARSRPFRAPGPMKCVWP
jgi:ATP-dependent DNA ligase